MHIAPFDRVRMWLDIFLALFNANVCFVVKVCLLLFSTNKNAELHFQVQACSEIISNAFPVLECSTSCPGGDLVDGLLLASRDIAQKHIQIERAYFLLTEYAFRCRLVAPKVTFYRFKACKPCRKSCAKCKTMTNL